MAATDGADFDADAFIAGIHLAMSIGAPADEEDRATFHFAPVVTNTDPADDENVPFNIDATPVVNTPATKTVPCAIQYVDAEGKVENFGIIVPAKVVLTFLEEDYLQIVGFDWVAIAGNRYYYRKTAPPVGMFTVGVWEVHCVAEDEG